MNMRRMWLGFFLISWGWVGADVLVPIDPGVTNGVDTQAAESIYTTSFFTANSNTYCVAGGPVVGSTSLFLYRFNTSSEILNLVNPSTNGGFDVQNASYVSATAVNSTTDMYGNPVTYLAMGGGSSGGTFPVLRLYQFDTATETFYNIDNAYDVQPSASAGSVAWFTSSSGTYLVVGTVYYDGTSLFVYKFDPSQIGIGNPLTLLTSGTGGFSSQYYGNVNTVSAFVASGLSFVAVAGQPFDTGTIRVYQFDDTNLVFNEVSDAVDTQPQMAVQALAWMQTSNGRYLIAGELAGTDGPLWLYRLNVTNGTLANLSSAFDVQPPMDVFTVAIAAASDTTPILFSGGTVFDDVTTMCWTFDVTNEVFSNQSLDASDQHGATIYTMSATPIGFLNYFVQHGDVDGDAVTSRSYRITL